MQLKLDEADRLDKAVASKLQNPNSSHDCDSRYVSSKSAQVTFELQNHKTKEGQRLLKNQANWLLIEMKKAGIDTLA